MSGIWASVSAVLTIIPSWLQCCCHSSSHHIHTQGRNNWEGTGSTAHVLFIGAFKKPLVYFYWYLVGQNCVGHPAIVTKETEKMCI